MVTIEEIGERLRERIGSRRQDARQLGRRKRSPASKGAAYIRCCCLMGHVASSRVAHAQTVLFSF
jgi:hypothetical protein